MLKVKILLSGFLCAAVISPVMAQDAGGQDYRELRDDGLGHVEPLGSSTWTDHNIHDPGITSLGSYCYGISDLANCSDNPIDPPDGESTPAGAPSAEDFRNAIKTRNNLRKSRPPGGVTGVRPQGGPSVQDKAAAALGGAMDLSRATQPKPKPKPPSSETTMQNKNPCSGNYSP